MGLTPQQNKALLNSYKARRTKNEGIRLERQKEIMTKLPQIKVIDDAIADKGLEISKLIFMEPEKRQSYMTGLKANLEDLKRQKEQLLSANGYSLDYLAPIYTCQKCKDTGFIDTVPCTCLKQAYINTAYQASNLLDVLETENFDTFSFDFYSTDVNPQYGISPYENMKLAYDLCLNFVKNFDYIFNNIVLYGQSGIGKTFLCNAIAKALLDDSHSVIYLSSFQLFRILETYKFHKEETTLDYNDIEYLYNCDLLIIDDLGAEMSNTFTNSELFNIINTRFINKKSTVISTNLTPMEWADHYSNRIASRLFGNYETIMLIGEDIRIQKFS